MPDITWQQALGICYYLGALASLLGAIQCTIDFYRKRQKWRLLGIPAHLGLASALSIIIIGTGADPIFSQEFIQVSVRVAFMVWAVFKLTFESFYCVTHIGVRRG